MNSNLFVILQQSTWVQTFVGTRTRHLQRLAFTSAVSASTEGSADVQVWITRLQPGQYSSLPSATSRAVCKRQARAQDDSKLQQWRTAGKMAAYFSTLPTSSAASASPAINNDYWNFADDSPVSEWTRCAMQAAMKRKTDEAAARDGAAITREVHTPASTENWSCLSLPAGGWLVASLGLLPSSTFVPWMVASISRSHNFQCQLKISIIVSRSSLSCSKHTVCIIYVLFDINFLSCHSGCLCLCR